MPTSQFKIYTSGDIGAPILTGISGSLVPIFDWCLVTGSGWLQPSASNLSPDGKLIQAIYKQPSGSGCVLYISDGWPVSSSAAGGKEAWAIGWESVSNMTAPVGTGSVQFPMINFLAANPSGSYTIRKSTTADSASRPWIMFADAYTMYLFTQSGDTYQLYGGLLFGDFYTYFPATDTSHCFIWGRTVNGGGTAGINDQTDMMGTILLAGGYQNGTSGVAARTATGFPTSSWIGKLGNMTATSAVTLTNNYQPMLGLYPLTNLTNNNVIITPMLVQEAMSSNYSVRGEFRGMYQICHPIANFYDGQILTGSNDQYGKVFQIVKPGPNSGIWAIEISNTLKTN